MERDAKFEAAQALFKETLPSRALVVLIQMGEVRREVLDALVPPVNDRTVAQFLEDNGVDVELIIGDKMEEELVRVGVGEDDDIWDLVTPGVDGENNPLVTHLRDQLDQWGVLEN